jgi:hypothetical protein
VLQPFEAMLLDVPVQTLGERRQRRECPERAVLQVSAGSPRDLAELSRSEITLLASVKLA